MSVTVPKKLIAAGFFLSAVIHCSAAFAQTLGGNTYEFAPRIRSYLQRPVTESDQYVEDISIPSMADEGKSQMMRQLLPERQMQQQATELQQVLIDKKIDPDAYIVGPGDILSIYLWGELDKEFPAPVSPEGLVIIPTVGPVSVADVTLREAQNRILDSVRKKYQGIDVTIYLVEPRQFRVYISGMIENPGMYNAHALLRVSDLLGYVINQEEQTTEISMSSPTAYERVRGGLYQRSAYMRRGEKKGSSKRTITVNRGDKIIDVDLLRFEKLGDLSSNPYVAGGDNVHVPQYQGDMYINGEVNNGGIYEFKKGDRICDLVGFGGGLTVVADTTNAKLVRFSEDGEQIINISINLYDALINDPDNPDFLVHESDRLFVQTKYNYKVLANVLLDGQVKFPGEYAIIPHVTKLSDIVNSAGYFTDQANLEEARIIRPVTSSMRDLEYERLRLMMVSDMTPDEYEYFKDRSRVSEGTISIDFVRLFMEHDASYDVVLEDGDQIFIPLKRELVNILGAVESPGYIKSKDDANLDYYIQLAGGYNWNAKKRSVRIIKAGTGQRLKPSKTTKIEGGDTIHVPEKRPIDYWQSFLQGTQLFANMATLIIIAQSLTD